MYNLRNYLDYLLPNLAHFVFSVLPIYIFVLSKEHHIIHFSAIIIREIDR